MYSLNDAHNYLINVYSQLDFLPVSGKGSRLYNQDGADLIDFAAGVAVNGLGHAHPELIKALNLQADQLWHVSNFMANQKQVELAKQLVENSCYDKVFFCNSGTEAVEAALKLARGYANKTVGINKHKIIAFTQSFHGRTLFSVSVGGQPKKSQTFAPLVPGIIHGEFNNIEDLKNLIDADTAAVIVEPIQAEGGIIVANLEFLQELRRLCDKFNAILIFDEVQTGIGRTGQLFAYQNYNVEPDIIALAKALGCGFPIGAILAKEKYVSGLSVGEHGSTFGGNPLACSVASKAFSLINQPEFLSGVRDRSKLLQQKLHQINQELDIYKEIRGTGLLIGAELQPQYQDMARKIMELGIKNGVFVLNASPNITRFVPPLNIPLADLEEGLERFKKALVEFKTSI